MGLDRFRVILRAGMGDIDELNGIDFNFECGLDGDFSQYRTSIVHLPPIATRGEIDEH